jgi:hypothetical protein
MNQHGGRAFLARLATAPEDGHTVTLSGDAVDALERGARVLFYELRGEGEGAKAYGTGWGSIERLTAADGSVSVTLREFIAFKRRVPFSELRTDPRRDRDADVQPVTLEVFNAVLARARR